MLVTLSWVSPLRFQMTITNVDENNTPVLEYFFFQGETFLSYPTQAHLILQPLTDIIVLQHTIKQNNHKKLLSFDTYFLSN